MNVRPHASIAPASPTWTSAFEDFTVTSLDPLRIKRDGDADALPITPDSMIDTAVLAVDDRVRVENADGRLIIHGVQDGGHLAPAVADTGWIDFDTAPSGWTYRGGTPQARQIGDVVFIRGAMSNSSFTGGFTLIPMALPDGIDPPGRAHHYAANLDTGTNRAVRIETTGAYSVYSQSTSTTWLPLATSYAV